MKLNWYKIQNKTGEDPNIFIYDEIGDYGITAKDFSQEIRDITAESIDLHIDSPGGSVFDGITIYNTLRDHKAKINVIIDGLAASIASVIAMVGDTVSMHSNSIFMMHKASAVAIGNSKDMRDTASILDKVDKSIAISYMNKSGLSEEKIKSLMDAETWLNADEARDYGFCQIIDDWKDDFNNGFDLSKFNNVPDSIRNMYHKKDEFNPRLIENVLRDAGISRSKAKAAVSAIKKDCRDDDEVSIADVLTNKMLLNALIIKLKRW